MYNNSFIDLLKSKITLSDVISRSVRIINHGKNKVACCPFHKEKTPSFHINDERGFYHCFGCGTHGDVISFVMQQENLNFKEAVEKLANESGIELPKLEKLDPKKQKDRDELDTLYKINEESCLYFQNLIFSSDGQDGLKYLIKRGLSRNNIIKFKIGFATAGFNDLLNHLKKLGFSENDMKKAGVVTSNEKQFYDKFRNRVMFPVMDKNGRVIAFSGRVINNTDMPKYMNSPETQLFHKSDVLFNYFFAKKSIYDKKNVILVEGNLDTITLATNGIENVVAPMGTATTEQQIRELWKITDEIVVCLDGDKAGQKAAHRIAVLVLPMITPSKSLKFVKLPDNKDPDDFIKEYGISEFEKLLNDKNQSVNLSEFLWKYELTEQNIGTVDTDIMPEEKNKLEFNISLLLKKIKDPIVLKNFESFYKNKLFLIGRNKNSKNKNGNFGLLYKVITKIDYGKRIPSINSMENLKERVINVEKNIVNIVQKDISIISEFFKKYEINLLSIDFFDKNVSKVLNIFYDKLNNNIIDDKIIFRELEKNDLKLYTCGDRLLGVDSMDDGLRYLYGLFLERNALVLEIELKELAQDNNNEERRKAIYGDLELLRRKITDLENDIL